MRVARYLWNATFALTGASFLNGCSLLFDLEGISGDLGAEAGTSDAGRTDAPVDVAMASDVSPGSVVDVDAESSNADGPLDSPLDQWLPLEALASDSSPTDSSLIDSSPRDSSPIDSTAGDAPVCTGDLSNIHTADFRISFAVVTTQGGAEVALVNQRSSCGRGVFWDLRMTNGFVNVEVDDTKNDIRFTITGQRINDGQLHEVLVSRSAETLVASVDGVASGPFGAPESLGALAPVTSGTDPCASSDMTAAFLGTLSDLCVTSP
jgi:hypothetical protein